MGYVTTPRFVLATLPLLAVSSGLQAQASAGLTTVVTVGEFFNEMSREEQHDFTWNVRRVELQKMFDANKLDEAACVVEKFAGVGGEPGRGSMFMAQVLESARRAGDLEHDAARYIVGVMGVLFKQCELELGR